MSKSVFIFACLFVVGGCSDSEATDDIEVATFEETDLSGDDASDDASTVRAVFVASALGGDAALVDHETIPGENMPAMRMQVALDRPDLIAGLEAGDKILLTIQPRESGIGFTVLAIEPLSPDTEMDLDGVLADSVFVPGAE